MNSTLSSRRALAAAAGLIALALAGCSSGSSSSPPSSSPAASSSSPTASSTATASASGSVGLRYGDAPALLIQCGLDAKTIKPPAGQSWYADGKVLPLTGADAGDRGAELSTWWDAHESTVVGGKSLADWQQWAAQHDALPPQVCGSSVSAAALQAKIAPGQPNPWGS